MKKFISVIAIMLMLALTACSNKETPPTTDNSGNTQSDSVTMLEEGVSTFCCLCVRAWENGTVQPLISGEQRLQRSH